MAINPISSVNNNYRNLYFGETAVENKTKTEMLTPIKQENNNLDAEVKELKKEHSKTRKVLIAVSAASALLIGGLLLRNHFSAKQQKMNIDTIKNKLKDTVQKLKSPYIDDVIATDILTDVLLAIA